MCRPTCGWLCQCVPACVWSECVDFCLGNWTAEASFLIKIWLCYSSCLCHLQHHPSPSPLVSSSSQNVCLPCVLITTEVWYQITVIVGIEFSEWSYPNISDRTWSFGCMEIPSAQLPSCWDNPTRGAALSRCAVISAWKMCDMAVFCLALIQNRWNRKDEKMLNDVQQCTVDSCWVSLALILSEDFWGEILCLSLRFSSCCFSKWWTLPALCKYWDSSVPQRHWEF